MGQRSIHILGNLSKLKHQSLFLLINERMQKHFLNPFPKRKVIMIDEDHVKVVAGMSRPSAAIRKDAL